jgi:UDPglucose--hexose-1-phosphate uridylyltransferase
VRRDVLLHEPVVVAAARQERTHLPPTELCPLCPSVNGRQTEIPSPDYDVVVFENRFPALTGGSGRCEVVCFTSDHDSSFSQLSAQRVATVIGVWIDRTGEMSAVDGVEQVFCFENRGAEIGVTLSHPHGQIYAYPFVTPRTARMLDVAHRHQVRTGRNLFDDMVAAERADGSRVVWSGRHWTAFVPFAARWPFEVHVYPHRRSPDLAALDDEQRDELAVLYPDLLGRFDGLFDRPMPYIAAWHQAPVSMGRDLAAVHLELFSVRRAADKLKYLAGSESGMDVFLNDVAPEEAAERLRRAAP